MANLTRGRGDLMGVAGSLNDNASVTAPVESYWANGNGLYCMAGNVSEWVADVYRDMSFEDVDEFNPYRGNVFMDLERSEDGSLVEKDSLGKLKYVQMNPITGISMMEIKGRLFWEMMIITGMVMMLRDLCIHSLLAILIP